VSTAAVSLTDVHARVAALLYEEAASVDEQRWDDWLALFDEKVEYWIPSWDSEHEHTTDPRNEVSLMFYDSRAGLEDRVYRILTERSAASLPLPRTAHTVSNIRVAENGDGTLTVKANWIVNLFRSGESSSYFGRYQYVLSPSADGGLKIARKLILVLNDKIATVLDIYSV
jgi:3-phenylpropionate/cinnamic acid dioxygenase small subunit